MGQKDNIFNFIEKSKIHHGDAYDYSKSVYIGSIHKIEIICKEHGSFMQRANQHTRGIGCPECGKIKNFKSTSDFYKANKKDFSHIIPPDGCKIISLTQGKYAIVDEEDYEKLIEHTWSASWARCTFYATTNINGKTKTMHRLIFNITDRNIEVDHQDRNGLNNSKSNLRVCTHAQNMMNKAPSKNKQSQHKGVMFDKKRKKWFAEVYKDGKRNYIGTFDDEIQAAIAYNLKAKEVFGEFAFLNKIPE